MFLDVLYGVLPLFFVMLVGYGASYSPKFPASVEPALNVFVFYVALPALLYRVVAHANVSEGVPGAFLGISAGAALGFALLCWVTYRYLVRCSAPRAMAGMLTTSFGNVSYLGIPVILGVLGPSAGFAAGMGQLVHNVIFMVGFPVLAQLMLPAGTAHPHKPSGGRILRTIRRALVYNPVTWAMLLGGAVAIWQLPVPGPLDETVDLLAAAAAPGALFTIGLSLRRTVQRLRQRGGTDRRRRTRITGDDALDGFGQAGGASTADGRTAPAAGPGAGSLVVQYRHLNGGDADLGHRVHHGPGRYRGRGTHGPGHCDYVRALRRCSTRALAALPEIGRYHSTAAMKKTGIRYRRFLVSSWI